MMKKFINGLLLAALTLTATSAFVSCKDVDEDVRTDLEAQLAKEASLREALEAQIKTLEAQIAETKKLAQEGYCNCDEAALKSRLDAAESAIREAQSAISEAQNAIKSLQSSALTVDNVNSLIAAEIAKLNIESIRTAALAGQDANNWVTANKEDISNKLKLYGEQLTELLSKPTTDEAKVNELAQKVVEEAVKSLPTQANITELQNAVTKAETALKAEIQQLKNILLEQVTSVVIQGTYNPVFGSFALPTNTRSQVLAAYYGRAEQNIVFPTADVEKFANQEDVQITEDDLEFLGVKGERIAQEGTILINEEGNAGTIYVTINPNTVDFTGKTIELVNSQDEKSGVTLSDLKKSDKKLSFGWTTRAANNGFYEAQATITKDDLSRVKANINLNQAGNDLKALIKNRNTASIKALAEDILSQPGNILDANGVKASYAGVAGNTSVYSEYNVAATAIVPLSYGSLSSIEISKVPGINQIENYVNSLINKMLGGLNESLEGLGKLDASALEIKGLNDDGTMTVAVTIPREKLTVSTQATTVKVFPGGYTTSVSISGNTGNITIAEQTVNVPATTATPNQDITIDVNLPINDMLPIDALQSVLNSVKGVANLGSTINDVKGQINNFFEKVNSTILDLINEADNAIQPTLLFNTSNGLARVSGLQEGTPVKGSEITIYPTSYTAEILAPAYKKFVAVTNVSKDGKSAQDGDANAKAALEEANASSDLLKVVLPGQTEQITIGALKSVYTYEILYTAVDYSGWVAARKFYIAVQ